VRFNNSKSDRLRVAADSTHLVLGPFNVFCTESVLVPTQRRLSHELASPMSLSLSLFKSFPLPKSLPCSVGLSTCRFGHW
jgi:hypothetical protein